MNRKVLERVLLAAAAVLAAAILLTFRRRPRPSSRQAVPAVTLPAPADAGKPTTLLTGFEFSQSRAGQAKFRIRADRTVGYAPGAGLPSSWYGLENVELTLYPDATTELTVKGPHADYDPRTNAIHLSGDVTMTEPGGVRVLTSRIEFDPAARQVIIPQPIEISRGDLSGHAASAVEDVANERLVMSGPVKVWGSISPGSPQANLESDRAVYDGRLQRLDFDGNVRGRRERSTFSSPSIRLFFGANRTLTRVEASGGISGVYVAEAAAAGSGAAKSFTGSDAMAEFDADGKISLLEFRGSPARVEQATSGRELSRVVTAPSFVAKFSGGIVGSTKASGGVSGERVVLDEKGHAARQSLTADSARTEFAAGRAGETRLEGSVRFSSPDVSAEAPAARLLAQVSRVVLEGSSSLDARARSPDALLVARTLDYDTSLRLVTATGSPRAYLRGGAGGAALPALVADSRRPTLGKADSIRVDGAARRIHFTGRAVLWQEDSALFADSVTLSDRDRTADAAGHVRATGPVREKDGISRAAVTSETLHYVEKTREAALEGGVTLKRASAEARGKSGTVHFGAANQIDQIRMTGDVAFQDPETGRRGTGDFIEDNPGDGVAVLHGSPAVAADGKGSRVEGAILTFRKRSGSVEVEAEKGKKVVTTYSVPGPH